MATDTNLQSATVVAQVFSASRMRIKLIARIMAEGMRDIFSLLHAAIALLDAHLKAFRRAKHAARAGEAPSGRCL